MSVGEHDRQTALEALYALTDRIPATANAEREYDLVLAAIEHRDALAAELAVVREERDRLRDALAWIKARADWGVADGHLMIVDAIEISNRARAALSVSVPDGQAAPAPKCATCQDRRVLDDNGNPSVWGRVDSHECPFCAEDDADTDASGGPAETAAETE